MAEKQNDRENGQTRDSSVKTKSNNFESVIGSLLSGANGVLSSKTVVGEPVQVGDTTLIPLNDVTIGAGAGSNNGTDKNSGMGGFAAKMSPSAVLVMRGGVTKVVNIKNQDSISKLVDLIPDAVDKIVNLRASKDMMSDEDAAAQAFPEGDEKQ